MALGFYRVERRLSHRMLVGVVCVLCVVVGFSYIFVPSVIPVWTSFTDDAGGDTPAARLARRLADRDPGSREPLLSLAVGTTDTIEGPALLFYSGRPYEVAYTLQELETLVGKGTQRSSSLKSIQPLGWSV